ncbi:MAG: 4-hydroxyphenylpyruvate dioxygenase [Chloroflexi bacterium AL-W]|nr:4-hydroxyphenylpyruvate dioxygenase [Chloroflexi bacterium AL-N1]NOK64704.1 4-hydroxyphenylpyruvate dioxygenase [Chloroflexi bacterium AL-N10]NOK75945.1 4-hydroxyphenylpyruvate dioxygenase [Chloroflexi bacterium AL-N5]NOK80296.1 4-hydroxyphenylpyruvate dioxygenase [Chloroflexi bacterium AL-W]NOK86809.1 4-hydroxyphenylpyruvate dioxygenase [Chloroflexi bacterium AL-N15]
MSRDPFDLQGIDYVEFYVSNARQAAHFYRTTLGLKPVAYAGLETGSRDRASWVLAQRNVRFVVSAPLAPNSKHPIAAHVARHGDGVKDVALRVSDAAAAYHEALKRGARGVQEPTTLEDDKGQVVKASIATYGDTIHSFMQRDGYEGPFIPGYQLIEQDFPTPETGIAAIDHIVGNVELGKMNEWVNFYADILGFKQLIHFDDQDVSTEFSALMSKVMQNGTGRIKFPINEPADGLRKSQIEEYLEYYGGPGVQHIALATGDIMASVDALRNAGIPFLRVPQSYYDELPERVGTISEDIRDLAQRGILVDRDDEGYLLQIFSQPLQDRPTLFIEIIQRRGSRGFGKGNFKALFEAIEREQSRRGNL